ncbi:nucleotidyl transferase AbiEii/AbiGii toxin family protein [Thiohalomonas denitrificans]|uniref:nucleotidyl transferase AbiEii/AbiGii toxin family protein n=1 Tax=Thiohalomonas denitrificans TaxID=415747 RepID=UPI0026EA0A24|nr:nucleotidyl transferase AbiEii/AbiGii toxin family protein [Thiohalomonas denitrificans]
MIAPQYKQQVRLLIRVLPSIARESCFALKGGTAINLFVRDLPRLSVDIDLVYLGNDERAEALAAVAAAFGRIKEDVERRIQGSTVTIAAGGGSPRMLVRANAAQVKVELSPVLRGTAFPSSLKRVVPAVEQEFGFAEMLLVSHEDLYGGKLVAALDRQHPRDLFDVHLLFQNEGLSEDLIRGFIVYLISHNRPFSEVLAPNLAPLEPIFVTEFQGMTREPIGLEDLVSARERLIREINDKLGPEHRKFLLSFKDLEPDWDLLGLPGIAELPAVRWKLRNISKFSSTDRAAYMKARDKLARILRLA